MVVMRHSLCGSPPTPHRGLREHHIVNLFRRLDPFRGYPNHRLARPPRSAVASPIQVLKPLVSSARWWLERTDGALRPCFLNLFQMAAPFAFSPSPAAGDHQVLEFAYMIRITL